VARALGFKAREVIVIESAPSFVAGTSTRNNEVVRVGIFYPLMCLSSAHSFNMKYISDTHVCFT
jgi:hypothetical protein